MTHPVDRITLSPALWARAWYGGAFVLVRTGGMEMNGATDYGNRGVDRSCQLAPRPLAGEGGTRREAVGG
jgi:hypothetical protein